MRCHVTVTVLRVRVGRPPSGVAGTPNRRHSLGKALVRGTVTVGRRCRLPLSHGASGAGATVTVTRDPWAAAGPGPGLAWQVPLHPGRDRRFTQGLLAATRRDHWQRPKIIVTGGSRPSCSGGHDALVPWRPRLRPPQRRFKWWCHQAQGAGTPPPGRGGESAESESHAGPGSLRSQSPEPGPGWAQLELEGPGGPA